MPTPSSSSKNCQAALKYGMRPSRDSEVDDLIFSHDIDNSGRSEEIELQEEAQCGRRLKRPVIGSNGKAVDAQRLSTNTGRPVGLRTIDMIPSAQKHCQAGSKRLFGWIHRPTAWDNPVTYEDPPELGKRPSHPVCANGVVALDRKRIFPEGAVATSIPLRSMSKEAPVGNTWGSWADGEPGRRGSEGPWQVEPRERELDEEEEAEFRVRDARVKINPEKEYCPTSWLTNWHWDAIDDVDPPHTNKYRENMPMASCTTTCEEIVYCAPAGKSSALAERSRPDSRARAMTPLTAR